VLSRHRLHAIGGHPAAATRPDDDPLRDVIEVLKRYVETGARTLAAVQSRLDQIKFFSPIIAHVLPFAAGPRQDRGCPSASVESAAPTVGRRNCVRLCLSETCVDDR
jgi:hypothetical protein